MSEKKKPKEKGVKHLEKQTKSTKVTENESDESDFEEHEEGGMSIGGIYIPPAPIAVCSAENVGPRLIITHIVNINFKSYAGRQVLGPFHKNFTSIIGPNGSGKSNVIDSMLFVFGYRATKIRSKKLSVLIHNSDQLKNIRSCTVEVHFVQINDKGGDYEKIPNTELVISRTANVDNQSQYAINGKNVRFKEVALLLRSHGIDLVHNRFLILQGEVEQIAMMKPKAQTEHDTGMLEYLEDIIGTNRYKVPIQKLEVKLEQLNNDRQEKLSRTQMMEKEVAALNEPVSNALEYLMKENEHIVVKSKISQVRMHDAKQKLEKYTKERETLESNLTEIKGKMKKLHDDLSVKEKEISKRNRELGALKSKREQTKETTTKSEKQLTEIKLSVKNSNQKRKKAIESKKQLEQKLITLKNVPEKNTKEIEELKKVEEKLVKSRAKEEVIVEETLASLQLETQGLQDNLTQLNNKLIGLKKIRDDANAKYQVAKTELDEYQSKEDKEKAKLDQFKESLVKINDRIKEEQQKSKEATTNLPRAQQELNNAEQNLTEVKNKGNNLRQEINMVMAKIQEKKNMMQDRKFRGRVLDFIMKQKEAGVVPGVFGRLGDLGGIEAKYDCAVSTACGPLDYVVTDSASTATKCVDLLKANNIGRANFIALDQQEKLKELYMKPIKTPENIPRLFDLIKVNDERVKPAFYFGLRDTLVATDLSQAKRCAYGSTRYRVVTLGGEIIEIVGTMSGGGREKRMGRMGRSAAVNTEVNTVDVNRLEQNLAHLQEQSADAHRDRVTLEETVTRLNNDIMKWKMNLTSCGDDVKELELQSKKLNQLVKKQESAVVEAAVNPSVVEEMTENVNTLKNQYDVGNNNAKELESEVKKIKAKIDAATGGKMKEVRQKLEKTITQLNKVTAEITKLGVDIKTAARDETKIKESIRSSTAEISENESIILKAEERYKIVEENLDSLNKALEKLNEEIGEIDEDIQEKKANTNVINKGISEINETKVKEDQKLLAIDKNIKEAEHTLVSRKKHLESLKVNELPSNVSNIQCKVRQIELVTYPPEEIEQFELEKLRYLDLQLEEQLNKEKANVNLNVVKDFIEKRDILTERIKESDEATARRNEVRKGYDEVRKARLNEFMAGFTMICSKLKEMYQMITLGGDAEFDLLDTLDPFSEGVLFSVRPPKKSWKNISNLSGGEKTLSSLALVFALHYYKPSPLYVMDEIDAALDFKNVSIVANYIKERTKNAQFIIISLRSNMFELADILVGIYKTYNCTKSVTITLGKYCTDDVTTSANVNNNNNNNHNDNNIEDDVNSTDFEPPPNKKLKPRA